MDVHVDPDGTANVDVRLGASAHVKFRVTREQQLKIWAWIRPALPYVAASVIVATAATFAVITATTPPTTA